MVNLLFFKRWTRENPWKYYEIVLSRTSSGLVFWVSVSSSIENTLKILSADQTTVLSEWSKYHRIDGETKKQTIGAKREKGAAVVLLTNHEKLLLPVELKEWISDS